MFASRVTVENLPEAMARLGITPNPDFISVHQLADEEARRLRHSYLGTEHQVLGLIRHENPVLGSFGIELDTARSVVELMGGKGQRPFTPRYLTPRAKKVVALSADEARKLGEEVVDSGLLLLALIKEGQGMGAGVIEAFGLDLGQVRRFEINRRYGLMIQTRGNP